MYSIALIQNESEMLRYSWADIRPIITNRDYIINSYTSENIETFFSSLEDKKFDAVVIAANACNDERIYNSLLNHKESIDLHLKRGGGLLVSFQMRLADKGSYGFLPPDYDVKAVNRIKEFSENPKEGNLLIPEVGKGHTVVEFPHVLNTDSIKNHCMSNNTVQGYYWTFLHPCHQEKYIPLFIDDSYDDLRNILIVSNNSESSRIILSSISLDWQNHTQLWENALRYVVKSRPVTAVISKKGQSNFDFRYMVSKLKSEKAPYHLYSVGNLSNFSLSKVHDIVILDPTWEQESINHFLLAQKERIDNGGLNVVLLSKQLSQLPYISIISNHRYQNSFNNQVLLWLQSSRNVIDSVYWQNSFWCTFEVLTALQYFNRPIDQFSEEIISEFSKHNIDGSYDEVMGASCAMLQIYVLFLGKSHILTQKTIFWIKQNISNKNLYEKATALDILTQLGIGVDDTLRTQIVSEIVSRIKQDIHNEFELLRYCRTLLSCGEIDYSLRIAKDLEKKQDKPSGKWVNLANTASIIDCLLDLYSKIEYVDTFIVEEMIFLGIQYIKNHFLTDGQAWQQDASTSSKCIVVLDKFEKIISLPVDLALQTMNITDTLDHSNSALNVASDHNIALLKHNRHLTVQLDRINIEYKKTKKKMQKRSIWATVSTAIVLAMVAIASLILVYLQENSYSESLKNLIIIFWEKYYIVILTALPSVAIIVFIYLMFSLEIISYKKLPKIIKNILKRFFKIDEKDVE